MRRGVLGLVLAALTAGCAGHAAPAPVTPAVDDGFETPRIPFAPRTYRVPKVATAPVIDGRLDDAAWATAAWTETYIDIAGPDHPAPRFTTRGKMAWDDEYFYFAAELEEPHLWATYTKRDSIIYHENDWEIFLDPDDDTHDYFELEINVLNTVWDLFLVKPYRDDGIALHEWDAPGLRHAVHANGTINDGSDVDRGWSIEVAWPWASLAAGAGTDCPPKPGQRWRVNFSRVQYRLSPAPGGYEKDLVWGTGEPFPEDNWVWSPQGLVNVHYPEMWGVVQFAPDDAGGPPPALTEEDHARWRLREAYYAQRRFRERHGRWASSPRELGIDGVAVRAFETGFEVLLRTQDGRTLAVREDGGVRRVTRE